jgi:site-specific DNA recombinase
MADASAQDDDTEIIGSGLRKQLADCERKLKQYRTLLDEGADAATVAGWMREVETERIGVEAKLRSVTGQRSMSPEEITAIVMALGDLVKVLNDADPVDKIRIYEQLGLRLTYNLGANAVDVDVKTLNGPGVEARSEEYVRNAGVRGGT